MDESHQYLTWVCLQVLQAAEEGHHPTASNNIQQLPKHWKWVAAAYAM